MLVPPDLQTRKIAATWGDYAPVVDKEGAASGKWQRQQRGAPVTVRLNGEKADPPNPELEKDGLQIVVSVRRIRRPLDLRGLPADTRAVSIFLVNRRTPVEGQGEERSGTHVRVAEAGEVRE